jgi:hypothetical protein
MHDGAVTASTSIVPLVLVAGSRGKQYPFQSVSRAPNRSIGRNRSIGPKRENPWNEGVALIPHQPPPGRHRLSSSASSKRKVSSFDISTQSSTSSKRKRPPTSTSIDAELKQEFKGVVNHIHDTLDTMRQPPPALASSSSYGMDATRLLLDRHKLSKQHRDEWLSESNDDVMSEIFRSDWMSRKPSISSHSLRAMRQWNANMLTISSSSSCRGLVVILIFFRWCKPTRHVFFLTVTVNAMRVLLYGPARITINYPYFSSCAAQLSR